MGRFFCPIEDGRELDSSRGGMLHRFSLGGYLLLVNYTARLLREGKTAIPAEVSGMHERPGTSTKLAGPAQKLKSGRLLADSSSAAEKSAYEKPPQNCGCISSQTSAVAWRDHAFGSRFLCRIRRRFKRNRPAKPTYGAWSLIPDRERAVPGDRSCVRVNTPQRKNRG